MCIICVDVQKGSLTLNEAWRNLGEMRSFIGEEHAEEVEELLWNKWVDDADDDWYTSHGHGD